MKLLELCEMWLDSRRNDLKIGTIECYKYSIRHIEKTAEVTLIDIQAQIDNMIFGGYSASTVKHLKVVMCESVKYGFHRGLCDYVPLDMLSARGAKPAKEVSAYTPFELPVLAAAFEQSKYYLLFRILIETGIRSGELLALRWDDVDYNLGALYITKTDYRGCLQTAKTRNSDRAVPLTLATLDLIRIEARAYSAERNTIAGCTYFELYREYVKICKKNHVSGGGLHRLRHTFATQAIRSGVDVKVVSSMLGHSTTQITYDLYCSVSFADKSAALRRIPSVFDGTADSVGGVRIRNRSKSF